MKNFSNVMVGCVGALLSTVGIMAYDQLKDMNGKLDYLVPAVATHTESLKTLFLADAKTDNDVAILTSKVDGVIINSAKLYALKAEDITYNPKRRAN